VNTIPDVLTSCEEVIFEEFDADAELLDASSVQKRAIPVCCWNTGINVAGIAAPSRIKSIPHVSRTII
jgi:hypothetical protein